MSRYRRMTICLTDIEQLATNKIYTAGNGKRYISVTTWDYDKETNQQDHDFSVSVTRTPAEKENKVPIIWVGGGLIVDH